MAEVRIGDNCLIAPNVGIYTAGHDISPVDRHKSGFAKPITIRDNSIIAAGSVVTREVPKNTIFAGNPAKKIKDIDLEK